MCVYLKLTIGDPDKPISYASRPGGPRNETPPGGPTSLTHEKSLLEARTELCGAFTKGPGTEFARAERTSAHMKRKL
eukprot:11197447-Lingulodinium_polyedra.AAC.1